MFRFYCEECRVKHNLSPGIALKNKVCEFCRLDIPCHMVKVEDPQTLGAIIKEHMDRKGETRVEVANGKYTVVMPDDGGLHALRYGKPWMDLVGDSLAWCLASELNETREKLKKLEDEIVKRGGGLKAVTTDNLFSL